MKKRKARKSQAAAPGLPGRYGRMSTKKLDAELARYDDAEKAWEESKEISDEKWLTIRRAGEAARRRGRPAKAPEERSVRVMLSIEPDLLAATDAAARASGLTRAGLIAEALRKRLKLKAL